MILTDIILITVPETLKASGTKRKRPQSAYKQKKVTKTQQNYKVPISILDNTRAFNDAKRWHLSS